MKLAAIFVLGSLLAGAALAEGCPTFSTNNTYIIWTNLTGGSNPIGGRYLTTDTLTFSIGTLGVSLACQTVFPQWNFGDGTPAVSAMTVQHRFPAAGSYPVTLRLTTASQSIDLSATVQISNPNSRTRVVSKPPPPPPLDERTLQGVSFELGSVDARPGDVRLLQLYLMECCVFFRPIVADVAFSIDPVSFATIDPTSGVLQIRPDAPGGVTFRAYANIEHGRRIVSADVYVDTPQSNPLRGGWTQIAEIPCFGSEDVAVTDGLVQFRMKGGNRFDATWMPFEVYTDYWGFYTFDVKSKRVTFGAKSGNYIPPNIDGEGTYELLDNGVVQTLRLKNIWLGRRRDDPRPPACGMVFRGGGW